jgi:hypothetical protein
MPTVHVDPALIDTDVDRALAPTSRWCSNNALNPKKEVMSDCWNFYYFYWSAPQFPPGKSGP